MNGNRVFDCLARNPGLVLDAGCGPRGSFWWPSVPAGTRVIAIDLYHRPDTLPADLEFLQMDVMAASEREDWAGRFDLIVADHLLEHLPDPAAAAHVFARLLAPKGVLHVGFPDASLFTDRFYRLIHPEGGGHISKLTKDSVIALMGAAGLEPVLVEPWEDSWTWLTDAFDHKGRGIRCTSDEDIRYIADVFRRELTAEKGYVYGWEMLFRRSPAAGRPDSELPAVSRGATWAHEHPWRRRWKRFVRECLRGTSNQRAKVVRDLKRLLSRRFRH